MAKQDRPRQRVSQRTTSKVPMTFYRAGDSSASTESPFKQKELPIPSRVSRFFARMLDGVLILVLTAVLLYSLFVNDNPKVVLNSEVYHSADTYQDAAKKILGSLKNRNKVTLNEHSIVNSMQRQFPEISSAYVELPIMSETPVIHLSIARPSFVLSNNGSSYIVSSDGVAIASSGQITGTKSLAVVMDQSGFDAHAGEQVMSAASVKFVNDLIVQLKHANVPISQIILPPLAQELDLKTADKPYYVKFYLGGDVMQQAGQFLATRKQFNDTNTQPAEYLDVRVPGKVFYK
jgi:hypothetical protein